MSPAAEYHLRRRNLTSPPADVRGRPERQRRLQHPKLPQSASVYLEAAILIASNRGVEGAVHGGCAD
nr:hypothetical protein JVH1_1162 [Rhodococcus sp. JVH1]